MRIPLADLRAQHAALRAEVLAAWAAVYDSAAFVNGPEVESFETEFAAYCGAQHCIAVANGTDALALALRAIGVGAGHAVAIPAFTFAATAEAVCHVGAEPLLVDIDASSFLIDAQALRAAAAQSRLPLRAVIPVHLYGQPASMQEINGAAHALGAAVVEDAAQAHGANYRGQRVGTLGSLACFSFYPTKNLGGLGDGGALTTNDEAIAAHLRRLRDHGQSAKYRHAEVGFNSRLDALQAAALRIKLRHLDSWNRRRQEIAAAYRRALAGIDAIGLPSVGVERNHVYHLFVIRCAQRDSLREHLQRHGIGSGLHYPAALHEQPAFAAWKRADLTNAETAARQVLALPMYPELSDAAVEEVCAAIVQWAER